MEGVRGPQRGWYHGWNIVAVLIATQMAVSALTYNALSLFLSGWSREFHAPVSELTLALTMSVLVGAPLSPFVGALCDRQPLRLLISIGLLWIAAFFIAISYATQAWQVIVLYGLGAPGLILTTTTPANALIARWFVRRIGLALGLTMFGVGIGGVLLPPLLAALLPTVGWRMIWRMAGVLITLVMVPVVLLVIRNAPTEREGFHYLSDDVRRDAGAAPHGHRGEGGASWREILVRRDFWLLVVIYLAIMGTGSALIQNLGPFALSRGFSARTAALLISVMGLSHLVSTLGLGLVADRLGPRLPLTVLAALVAAGVAIMGLCHDLRLIVVGAALVGLNTGVFTPLGAAITRTFGAQHSGQAFGLAMLFLPLSSPFAFSLAKTHEVTGSYTPALIVFVAILAVAFVCSLLLANDHPGQRNEKRADTAFSRA